MIQGVADKIESIKCKSYHTGVLAKYKDRSEYLLKKSNLKFLISERNDKSQVEVDERWIVCSYMHKGELESDFIINESTNVLFQIEDFVDCVLNIMTLELSSFCADTKIPVQKGTGKEVAVFSQRRFDFEWFSENICDQTAIIVMIRLKKEKSNLSISELNNELIKKGVNKFEFTIPGDLPEKRHELK